MPAKTTTRATNEQKPRPASTKPAKTAKPQAAQPQPASGNAKGAKAQRAESKNAKQALAKKTAAKGTEELAAELVELLEDGRANGEIEIETVSATLARIEASDAESEAFFQVLRTEKIKLLGDDEEEAAKLSDEDLEAIEQASVQTDTSDSVRIYLNQISKRKLLTADEEVELAKRKDWYMELRETKKERMLTMEEEARLEAGKRAFDDMVCANLRLVVSIAARYRTSGLPLLDLIQEGALGLMRAIEKFDWTLGYKLSTYATWWIRQAITRALADQRRTIRIPVHRTEEIAKLKRAVNRLSQTGREPTIPELAAYLEMTVAQIEELKQLSADPISLHLRVGSDGDSEYGDLIADDKATQPENVTMDNELRRVLQVALNKLPLKERRVIMLRFGLGDGEPERTLEEVALRLGGTREKVRGIETDVIRRLQEDPELLELIANRANDQ